MICLSPFLLHRKKEQIAACDWKKGWSPETQRSLATIVGATRQRTSTRPSYRRAHSHLRSSRSSDGSGRDPARQHSACGGGGRVGRLSRRLGSRGLPEGNVVSSLGVRRCHPHSNILARDLEAIIREWRPGGEAPAPALASQAGLFGIICRSCCGLGNAAR